MVIYLIPFISAFIGWFTNWIAIRMLFHPREEKNILGIRIQGIFPKRQKQFALKLGSLVSRELISFDELAGRLNQPQNWKTLMPYIEQHVDKFLQEKMKEEIPLLSMFISEKTLSNIKAGIIQEIESMLPELFGKLTSTLKQEMDVEQIVVDKVSKFSSDKLELILKEIMSREFRFVELTGAVLGFLIGLFQVLLTAIS